MFLRTNHEILITFVFVRLKLIVALQWYVNTINVVNVVRERIILEYSDKWWDQLPLGREKVRDRKSLFAAKNIRTPGQIHPFQLFNINQIRLAMNELGNFGAEKIKLYQKSSPPSPTPPLTGLNWIRPVCLFPTSSSSSYSHSYS